MQGETEGAMKISASRASKRAPTWHSCTITPKSLSGQPLDWVWIRRSRGWPERDFGVIVQLCHVGARFEALDALIFIAPSVSSCIFLPSQISLWNDVWRIKPRNTMIFLDVYYFIPVKKIGPRWKEKVPVLLAKIKISEQTFLKKKCPNSIPDTSFQRET